MTCPFGGRWSHSHQVCTHAMASLLQSLADRLTSLSIVPGAASESSVLVKTYAFKPKGGSSDAVKLVLVAAEESKEIGKASALAKTLGFKDMRAAEDDYVREIVGEGKAAGTCSSALESGKTVKN